MATASQPLPPLPRQDVPLLLPNGTVNPDWYLWMKILESIVKQLREEV